MSINDVEKAYLRYVTVLEIVNIANVLATGKFYDRNVYEIRNCLERWLLTRANSDSINILTKKEIGYIALIQELQSKTRSDILVVTTVVNNIRRKVHEYTTRDFSQVVGDRSQLIIGADFVQYRDYIRKVDSKRIELLLRIARNNTVDPELALGLMIMTYASILPGAQHWNASEEHYRIYYNHGITVEGFASPINAQLIAIDPSTHFCSLFPHVDKVFGSIGNFFDIDFEGKIAVGPPYTEELLLKIANKIIKDCESNRKVRFYVTHADWKDAAGYIKMQNSPFCIKHEVVPKGKHYYMNTNTVPNEKITAPFDTVLFILSNYRDNENFDDLLNGLKL